MADEGYWEDDRMWVQPEPGTGPEARFEAWVVRITHTGKLCHYSDGRIAIYDEADARVVAGDNIEDGVEAIAERVMILVVPADAC